MFDLLGEIKESDDVFLAALGIHLNDLRNDSFLLDPPGGLAQKDWMHLIIDLVTNSRDQCIVRDALSDTESSEECDQYVVAE